jgi:hypothetical protein
MNGAIPLLHLYAFLACRLPILPSFSFTDLTASNLKPFRDGQFSSKSLIKTPEITCPENVKELKNMSLSRNGVAEPISNTASNTRYTLRSSSKRVRPYWRAVDENRDVNYYSAGSVYLRS